MLNFCLNCGNDEIGTSRFCFHCGSEITDIEAPDIFVSDTLLDRRYKIISLLKKLPPFVRDATSNTYKIQYLLKESPEGIVYIAEDLRFKNMCLVKELVFNYGKINVKEYTETLRNKIKLFSNIRHPSVPAVTNYFVQKGRHYLVMDYFKGKSLREILGEEGKPGISQKNVISWAIQILDLLDSVHNQHIVYRSIYPDVIMVKDTDKRIVLLDFHLLSPGSVHTGMLPAGKYSAPEELTGSFSERSDLFSLGAIMYYLLTGREENFTGGKIKPLKDVLPGVHPSLARIINTCLAADPEKRYPSASYMKKELFKTSRIEVKKAEETKKIEEVKKCDEAKKSLEEKKENLSCEEIVKEEVVPVRPDPVFEKSPAKRTGKTVKISLAFLIFILLISFYMIIDRYTTQNIFNEGVNNFKKATDGKKTYSDSSGKLGYKSSEADYKKAVEYFQDCIKRKKNYYQAYYMLGHIFYGFYELEMLKSEFEHIPPSPSSEFMDKAIENYKKALLYNSECPEASYYLARCYYHLGDMDSAREELNNTEKNCAAFPDEQKKSWTDKINSAKNGFLYFDVNTVSRDAIKTYSIVEFTNEIDSNLSLEFKGKNIRNISILSQRYLSEHFKPGEYIYTVKFRDISFHDKVNFEAGRAYSLNLKEIHDTFVNPDL
ncbi:MAG: protein kinase [Candidatus Eremiobacterota bacterium]